ncbi:MAG: DUF116 domain-containing protein [Nanoarchaeota archaeon]|nr:DUF116 domain-containing protein [Nanoarchaeota archaeon]
MKLLFLPHCLNKRLAGEIYSAALEKNYRTYIVSGSSRIKKYLDNCNLDEIEKIVGVACGDEINLAKNYLEKIGFKEMVFSVQLSEDGCKNTKVNLEKVLSVL